MYSESQRQWHAQQKPPVGQLRLGATYRSRMGSDVKIVEYRDGRSAPFVGDDGCEYYPDGRYSPNDMCLGTLWKEVTKPDYRLLDRPAFYFDNEGKCLYLNSRGEVVDHEKRTLWSARYNQDGIPTGSNPRYQSPINRAAAYIFKITKIVGEPQDYGIIDGLQRPLPGSEKIRYMYYVQMLYDLPDEERKAIKSIIRLRDEVARIAMVPPIKPATPAPPINVDRIREINAKLLWLLQQDMPDKNYLPRAVDPDFTHGYGFGGDITAIHKRYIQCESAGVRITEVILRGGPGMKPRKYGDTGCGCSGREIVETPIVGVEGLRKNAAPHQNREDLWKIFEPFWTKVWTQRRMWRLTKGLPEETITW